ncbi:unnamed protein product [Oreochromis niloticus]|nr:unnamed protein product [Mustela putorius furo]
MGNKTTKLTADEQWLEKKCPGAGQISACRWRNPKKTKCPTWEGKCSPSALTQLEVALKTEKKNSEKDPKKKLKREEEYKLFQAWETEAERRTENKKKKEENKKLFKRTFIKGLLPPIRSHVEKNWVTQDTGTADEAFQYVNHAQTVVKRKEKVSVFALDADTVLTAFSGGYRGGFRGQKRGRGMRRGRARGRDRPRYTPNSNYSTTCWKCGKKGHFARDCKTQRTPDTE